MQANIATATALVLAVEPSLSVEADSTSIWMARLFQGIPVVFQADLDGFASAKNSGRSLGAMEMTAITVKMADIMAVIIQNSWKNWVEV